MVENENVPIESEIPIEIETESILDSVKKMLGIYPEMKDFDPDIMMNINSAIATLTQLGVGPENGFFITGAKDTYKEFLGEYTSIHHFVKMYLYFRAKLGFDPPSSSFVLSSVKEQITELEWRLKTMSELQKKGGENSK